MPCTRIKVPPWTHIYYIYHTVIVGTTGRKSSVTTGVGYDIHRHIDGRRAIHRYSTVSDPLRLVSRTNEYNCNCINKLTVLYVCILRNSIRYLLGTYAYWSSA